MKINKSQKLEALRAMREAKAELAELKESPAPERLPPLRDRAEDQPRKPREIIDDVNGLLFGVKNKVTRQYVHVIAMSCDRAKAATGWPIEEISYVNQLQKTVEKKPEGAKKSSSKIEDGEVKKSEENKMKIEKKAEKKIEKNTEKKVEKKAEKKAESGSFADYSPCSVIKWMGKHGGFDVESAFSALKRVGYKAIPTLATIARQLAAGKKGERGKPAPLSVEQQKQLKKKDSKV